MATGITTIFNHFGALERAVPTEAIIGQRPGSGLCKIAHLFKFGASAAGPIASPPGPQNAALILGRERTIPRRLLPPRRSHPRDSSMSLDLLCALDLTNVKSRPYMSLGRI